MWYVIRILLLLSLFSNPVLRAQNSRVPQADPSGSGASAPPTASSDAAGEPLRVGPYLALPLSINAAQIPDGWKTALRVEAMPDMGLHVLMPVMSSAGLYGAMNLGFHRADFVSRPYTAINDSNTRMLSVACFEISPMIALPYAYAGLRIALPLSASMQSYDGAVNSTNYRDSNGAYTSLSSVCKPILELQAGGQLPLLIDAQGTLYATATISYQLGSAFKDGFVSRSVLYDGAALTASQDPRSLSLSIGLLYLFEL